MIRKCLQQENTGPEEKKKDKWVCKSEARVREKNCDVNYWLPRRHIRDDGKTEGRKVARYSYIIRTEFKHEQ